MYRVRAARRNATNAFRALHMTGADVRKTFLEYFKERDHVFVRSSSVVPLCDPTVPFVNAGMNQFKGIFLGRHTAPHSRVVNSQKCVRVGGKHNDLDVVGTDGTHHTLFEMLGSWSFGDYYKEDACKLAWSLLTGPYRLRPEELLVTYFAGDAGLCLQEDKETRDIWRDIGVQSSRIKPLGVADNFWEMGVTGPCGPCTEIHHVASDGTLTEIWNLVFIQYNREANGSIVVLPRHHVDTGMGLERATALLQGVSNYDTDLFLPIIRAVERESRVTAQYSGQFGDTTHLDTAYRCLADHARMISVCLADGMLPAVSLNLKQIMRRSFKLSEDVFRCKSGLLCHLYDIVAEILGPTYPEIIEKMRDAKTIIRHEENSYAKLRSNLAKRWKDLAKVYPEVENLADVEISGFVEGYKQFKQAMSNVNGDIMPGDVVFKLYDTHGFSQEVIARVAKLNDYKIDEKIFQQLLHKHRSRHKTAFKEQADNKTLLFDDAINKLNKLEIKQTNDIHKYSCIVKDSEIIIPELNTKIVALLNSKGEWLDAADINEELYIVTNDTNLYCEDGGQIEDRGKIKFKDKCLDIVSVFKIRDIVFHKVTNNNGQVILGDNVNLQVDSERRVNCMRNHTATHLLNAALRKVLPDRVVYQVGSKVSNDGLVFNIAVYGDKLTQDIVLQAEDLVRRTIRADVPVWTEMVDSVALSGLGEVATVPGQSYPDTGLRLVRVQSQINSRELCCGTHVPSTGHIGEFCVTSVRGAGGNAPVIRAVTGDRAKELVEICKEARALEGTADGVEPRRLQTQAEALRERAARACGGAEGAPHGQHAVCLQLLDKLQRRVEEMDTILLNEVAVQEMRDQIVEADKSNRSFIVHFLLCSYLMESASLLVALSPCTHKPAMVFGCANGVIKVACRVPKSCLTRDFTAEKWLSCVLPVFNSKIIKPGKTDRVELFAAMTGTKVSLINCEALVRDAMKAAVAFADAHTSARDSGGEDDPSDSEQQRGRRRS